MKKLIIIFCTTCISISAIAQQGVRIGNMELIVRKYEQDTAVYINVLDCPKCPQENVTNKPKANTLTRRTYSDGFWGIGFILPDNSSSYYTTLGGNSINIEIGQMSRYHFSPRFALGGTLQYSYYNYKLKDAVNEPNFNDVVLGNKTFANDDIRKQTFRSHNAAAGAFTRFYLIPPEIRNGRIRENNVIYIDLGAQGDFAFSKYAMLKTHSEGKKKYNEDYAFNPFSASAIARLGWKKSRWNVSSNKWNFEGSNSRAIFVRYRFTDAFNQKALPMDLPPITIGIQFF